MNKPFRTSGKTTAFALLVTVLVFSCSCAVTPTTTPSSLDPTGPTPSTTVNGTSVKLVTSTAVPESLVAPAAPTNSVQDVSETSVPSVTTTTASSPSIVTDQSSSPSIATSTSTQVPVSSSSVSPVVSTTTVASVSTASSTQSISSSTTAVPVSTQSASSTQSIPPSTLATPTSAQSNSTQSTSSSTVAPSTTTTASPSKPLVQVGGVDVISLDPSAGIVITEPLVLEQLASNGSKLTIKYVNKGQDALAKQTQKFVFKSDAAGNATKFVAKYLVKNASVGHNNNFQDFMPDYVRNNGGVIVHVILLVYVCLSLGIICDLYFLTSIEYIGNTLNLPADIAGATFMALGTSAPELFIALIGVFIAEDDIGTSTILGSAVFNLIFVPSVCGFAIYFSGMKEPKINKYSILRDAIFYMIAITTLLLALKDNEIDWIESVCMLSLYCIYITILYFNAQLGELVEEDDESTDSSTDTNETSPLLQSQNSTIMAFTKSEKHMLTKSADWLENGGAGRLRKGSIMNHPMLRSNSIRTSSIRNGSMLGLPTANGYLPIDPKTVTQQEPCGMPENWAESHWLLKILMLPVVLLIKLTVPKPNKYNYFLTFIVSILWISGFTYLAVWLVTIIGYALNLPQTVLGLTILAAGSSIPEVISSVIVVKRAGLANMALCNLFGSNIFDILVCLGLPWLIKTLITMVNIGSTDLLLTVVTVQSNGLLLTTFTLLVCVISFVFSLGYFDWKFGLGVGVVCSVIYFTAITLATVYEIMLN